MQPNYDNAHRRRRTLPDARAVPRCRRPGRAEALTRPEKYSFHLLVHLYILLLLV